MRAPIILIAVDDAPSFYQSVEDAEFAMEPVDVRDGLYSAYDASGRPLRIEIVERRRGYLLGLISVDVEAVKLSVAEVDQDKGVIKLEHHLARYLQSEGLDTSKLTCGLQKLIDSCIDRLGFG